MKINRFLALFAIVASFLIPIPADAGPDKVIVGQWKDNKYSGVLNAGYEIYESGGRYYLLRTNSDGSKGAYHLEKMGNKYIKSNDRFGVYYVVSPRGLKIFDKMGYIRTAKPK